MYLCVCVSDSAHALIGRQPSRDVLSSLIYMGPREGGQRIAAMPTSYTGCMRELHGICIASMV